MSFHFFNRIAEITEELEGRLSDYRRDKLNRELRMLRLQLADTWVNGAVKEAIQS